MSKYDDFIATIQSKKLIKVRFISEEKGMIERICIPFDFGPWRRKIETNPDRYHLYDLNSPEGEHNLSILPEQLISLEVLNDSFDPADYVTWTPNWFIKRDWGAYS